MCAGLTMQDIHGGINPHATPTAVKETVFPFSELIGCRPDAG